MTIFKKPLLIEFFAKHIETNGKNGIIGGVIEINTKNKTTSSNVNHDKIKSVLEYLTEKDKAIIEGAMYGSKDESEKQDKETLKKMGVTKREIEVLKLICSGLTNSEIAEQLFLSKRTIDRHRANIMDKTNSGNTAKLVAFAIKYNLVDI